MDVACQAFLLSSCIVLSFHTTRKTILSLFTPLIGDWFYIYIYLSRIPIILHCSINPCFWEGVHVARPTFLLSSCIALSPTLLEKTILPLFTLLGGDWFLYIYIVLLSRNSSIILHCSINPCFWEGVDVAFQTFLLSSCIALSFRTTREKTTLPLFTPLIGDWFYTYIVFFFQEPRLSSFMPLPFHTFRKMPFNHSFLSKGIEFSAFFKNLFYHPSLLSQSMLFGGGGCCMPIFSFIILHCPVIPYY